MVNPDNTKVNFRLVSQRDRDETDDVRRAPPPPDAKEKFQKVLRKEGEGQSKEEDNRQAVKEKKGGGVVDKELSFEVDPDEPKKGGGISLFDLSRGAKDVAPKVKSPHVDSPLVKKEEPAGMFGLIEPSRKGRSDEESINFAAGPQNTGEIPVTPMAMVQNAPIETRISNTSTAGATPMTNIQDVIDQIVDKAVQVQQAGKTETTITIKNNALLNGAQVVLTEFNTAKGEFNISFQGLTQAAKAVLDMNQNTLLQAFESKGFTVHILTTTTVIETPIPQEGSALTRGFPNQKEEEQQQQQRKEREKQEDQEA